VVNIEPEMCFHAVICGWFKRLGYVGSGFFEGSDFIFKGIKIFC